MGHFLSPANFSSKKPTSKPSKRGLQIFPAIVVLNAHPVNPPWVSCGSCFDPYMLPLILHHYTLELHVYKFLSPII